MNICTALLFQEVFIAQTVARYRKPAAAMNTLALYTTGRLDLGASV